MTATVLIRLLSIYNNESLKPCPLQSPPPKNVVKVLGNDATPNHITYKRIPNVLESQLGSSQTRENVKDNIDFAKLVSTSDSFLPLGGATIISWKYCHWLRIAIAEYNLCSWTGLQKQMLFMRCAYESQVLCLDCDLSLTFSFSRWTSWPCFPSLGWRSSTSAAALSSPSTWSSSTTLLQGFSLKTSCWSFLSGIRCPILL